MSFIHKSLNTFSHLIIIIAVLLLITSSSVLAQFPEIEVDIGDTTAYPGTTNSVISVYLTNRVDVIDGFNLYIELDPPGLMVFQDDTVTIFDTAFWKCLTGTPEICSDSQQVLDDSWDFFYDSTYLDTIGSLDTTGTLSSGWELVDSRSSGFGRIITIAGIADLPGGINTPGIQPSLEGGVLVKVLVDVFNIDDTVTDRTANLLLQTNFKDHFGFSNDGTSLTWVGEERPDTTCHECTQWAFVPPEMVDTVCVEYIEVSYINYDDCDSVGIGTKIVMVLDTANVKVSNGSVTIGMSGVCGNIDGMVDPVQVDIDDLVYFVNFVFKGGPPPDPLRVANVDCDELGIVDVDDLVMMVNYTFKGGEPICQCN